MPNVDEARRERVEAISLRIVGACFMALAIHVSYDSVKSLIRREAPDERTWYCSCRRFARNHATPSPNRRVESIKVQQKYC